jgi:hypothetical protein
LVFADDIQVLFQGKRAPARNHPAWGYARLFGCFRDFSG